MASEVTQKVVRDNMHINTIVIVVADFKSSALGPLWPFGGHVGTIEHLNDCYMQYIH